VCQVIPLYPFLTISEDLSPQGFLNKFPVSIVEMIEKVPVGITFELKIDLLPSYSTLNFRKTKKFELNLHQSSSPELSFFYLLQKKKIVKTFHKTELSFFTSGLSSGCGRGHPTLLFYGSGDKTA
jgi:hypothetical protein